MGINNHAIRLPDLVTLEVRMLELRACGDLEVLCVLAYLDIRGGVVSAEIRKLHRSTQKGDA